MIAIEILYTLAAVISLSACVPQLRQLVISKRSDEFSLRAWSLWILTQLMTLLYVISIGNMLMTFVNVAWVSFYALMTYLIIRYRRPAQPVYVKEPTEV